MSEDHWGFVLLAYGVAAATVLALVARIVLDHRRLRAELARLEKSGVTDRGEAR